MPEKPLPFVITDRRKFNPDGEARAEAPVSPPAPETTGAPEPIPVAQPSPEDANTTPGSTEPSSEVAASGEESMPPTPTAEQMEQSRLAFLTTADRLDTAIRAANPGMEQPPAMSFVQLVQSVYMQTVMQLGGGTPEGEQPQIDILGARQSIDMLGVLEEKTKGNLESIEETLLLSALFELRLAFLEMTQALARSAQQRAVQEPAMAGGPRIVR